MRDEEEWTNNFVYFFGEGECRRKQLPVFCEMLRLLWVWRFFSLRSLREISEWLSRPRTSLVKSYPYIYTFKMSLRARTIGKRLANLPIIPIPIARSGNNKPKSLQKTKRTFQPNLTRVDWPVTVLGGPVPIDRTKEQSLPKLEGILMQVRKIRDVEKAGGIEGLLVGSTSVNRGSC